MFSEEERHLYLLLSAHSDAISGNFAAAEKTLSELIDDDPKVDYKGRAHSILASVLHLQ